MTQQDLRMQVDREKELKNQLNTQVQKEQTEVRAEKAALGRFKKAERLVEVVEATLGAEDQLRVYLSLEDLQKMEQMIIQTMQEHRAEMEASPLHMLMVECAKDIEEFAWVLSEGVAVRSASSESIQSFSEDEPAGA